MQLLRESKLLSVAAEGLKKGVRTFLWLAAIMVPVSFVVFILQHWGVIDLLASFMEAPFRAIGLPGSSAIVVVTSLFLSLYSAIGVMLGLGLDLRAMTILAVVCLIAHNYLVELVVTRKTGTPVVRMLVVRSATALIAGYALHLTLPPSMGVAVENGFDAASSGAGAEAGASGALADQLLFWLQQTGELMGRVLLVVTLLMLVVAFLQNYGVTKFVSRHLSPMMRLFGLPGDVAFLWVVSNTLGLSYGAGVLMEEVKEGRLSRRDGDLLNHHLSISHSLLEDTLLFAALGIPVVALVLPRLLLAIIAVWERRAEQRVRSRFHSG